MKKYSGRMIFSVLFCFCAATGWAAAADTVRVPEMLVEIGDVSLRKALEDHSPNYDELSRGSQVFTFVHVYTWHEGVTPKLLPEDSALLSANAPEIVTHPSDVVDVDSIHIDNAGDTVPSNVDFDPDWFDRPRLVGESRL